MTRQTSQPGTNDIPSPSPTSVTSLIPLPSPLPNNLGVSMHHINQASITPTILGGFPMHQSSPQQGGNPNAFVSLQQTNVSNKLDTHHPISPHGPPHHSLSSPGHHVPPGIYVTTRPMHPSPVTTVTGIASKVKQQQQQQQQHQQVLRPNIPTNGTPSGPSTVVLRYPPQIQAGQQQQPPPQQQQQQQQHPYQMMKPRMMAPNAFGPRGAPPPHHQLIMQPTAMQQSQMMYDPNNHYRTTTQQQPQLPQQQQQQQQITQLQANSHMNDGMMNQQKHPHQQTMLQLPPGMLTTDDNILKSLLKVNPQAVS